MKGKRTDDPTHESPLYALIVQIEATEVCAYKTPISLESGVGELSVEEKWDPRAFLTEPNGVRLFEELARRTRNTIAKNPRAALACLGLTLPGTLEGVSVISGSSRLGIWESVDVTSECERHGLPPVFVFHDVESLAVGEALTLDGSSGVSATPPVTFAYILVDEGVGSALIIDGRPYRGAGVAGHIGRLLVEPRGAFNPTFTSRGTLELFVARPWVSQSVVNEYLAEKDKHGALDRTASAFRAVVDTAAARGRGHDLTVAQLANGIRLKDPIVTAVLDEAAQYLSLAINAIITIMNPPLIYLAGEMITELPGFSDQVLSYARRNSWAGSWNETTIRITRTGRQTQITGAAKLLSIAFQERHRLASGSNRK